MKSSATEFELFTQRVYQKLVNNDVLKPAKVEHNVKLKGKSGCEHQIDVYWEYEIAGNKHRVAIECKNYNKRVEKEKVCAFQGVLADLDNVGGIMVTKIGFQKGAKIYAKQYGISLKELREPNNGETIVGEMEIRNHIERWSTLYKVDEKWAEKHNINILEYKRRMDLISHKHDHKWSNATYIPLTIIDDVVRNAKGDYLISLDSIGPQIRKRPVKDFPYILPFENAYINSKECGTIKILEVKYDLEREKQQMTFALDAEGFVEAILKDAISGVIQHIPKVND